MEEERPATAVDGAERRCAECGHANPPTARFCFCGHNLSAKPAPPPAAGVGGWLLFFCLQMLILNPILVGSQVYREYAVAAAAGVRSGPLMTVVAADSIVRLGLVAWGFACGVALVLRMPRAVRMVRTFLPVLVITYFLLVGLPFVIGVPDSVRMHVAGLFMFRAATLVLSGSLWFIYFKQSKRVQATYGTGSREPA
jgi:hypothetical protein